MRSKYLNKYFVALMTLLLAILIMINIVNKPLGVVSADNARASVVMEGNTYTVIGGHNYNDRLAMASTTKIVTAIVAIENCKDINEMVSVNDSAIGIEGTSIYLKKGETLSLKELLYGLILASGNDSAVAIAYHIGGTEENFVNMMNEFANSLSLTDTHFDNPHGLDSGTHYTNAYDLAKITSYALKNKIFRDIVGTKFITISGNDEVESRYLKHKNKLLFLRDDCIGVKTGFTDNAGRCLVHASEKDGMMIVTVVLNDGPMFEDADVLTKTAQETYMMKEFIAPYTYVGNISIINGSHDEVSLAVINGYSAVIRKDEVDKYRVETNIVDSLIAPVYKNQVAGKMKVYYGDDIIYETDIYAIDNIENIDIKYSLDNIIKNW